MSFLQGLHGALALALLLGLLFAEEAGVPLPFAPGELTLVLAGLLIASDALNPFVFVPLAIAACIAGAMLGFGWARLAGERGLQAMARRLRQERALERVTTRLRSGGALGVAIARLIPGLRIYTTLVAGAVRVPRATFLAGMIPSTVVWVVLFVVLGAVIGLPVEHFFNQIERVAVQGVILLVLGVGVFLAVRKIPATSGAGIIRLPRAVRIVLAAIIDIAVVASIITGVLALGRRLFGLGLGAGWLDAVAALVVVAVFYVVIARRSAGATVGEALLTTSYASGSGSAMRPAAAIDAARRVLRGSGGDLEAAADVLHGLGDAERLRIVRALLQHPSSADELAALDGGGRETQQQLEWLRAAGIVLTDGATAPRYRVRDDLVVPLLDLLHALSAT